MKTLHKDTNGWGKGPTNGRRRTVMGRNEVRIALIVLEVLIGLNAVGGGIALLFDAFNQWLPVTFLQGTPFHDYTIPGLLLTFVIGGGMLLAAATQYIRHAWAVLLSAAMGLFLICWEIVEIAIIDRFEQAVVTSTVVQQILFLLLGLVIFELAIYLWTTEYTSRFGAKTHRGNLQRLRHGES
jgi:hypothetical protein